MANIDANDLRFKLKGMIKNALSAIGSDPMPTDAEIETAIKNAIEEYRTQLVVPLYYPQRKYLATPVCPQCSNQMALKEYNGELRFCCTTRVCNHTIEAEII